MTWRKPSENPSDSGEPIKVGSLVPDKHQTGERMTVYEVTISYRFDADDPDHAIEQFVDAIIEPEKQSVANFQMISGAITDIRELPNRSAP